MSGYLPVGPAAPVTLSAIRSRIHGLPTYGLEIGPGTVQTAEIDDADWASAPGIAFGSGLHPSTQMCLTVLQERMCGGERVFDVGAGSGILSIAAAKLGASRVLAIDTDPVAVAVARASGFRILDIVRSGEWRCLVLSRPDEECVRQMWPSKAGELDASVLRLPRIDRR